MLRCPLPPPRFRHLWSSWSGRLGDGHRGSAPLSAVGLRAGPGCGTAARSGAAVPPPAVQSLTSGTRTAAAAGRPCCLHSGESALAIFRV